MSKTILVIDNSASIRQLAAETLNIAGYDVILALDVADALKQLDSQKIHLIIYDLNMEGIDFVNTVSKLPAYKFTPVVLLVANIQEYKQKAGQADGIKAFILKPFQPAQMLAAVSKLILP